MVDSSTSRANAISRFERPRARSHQNLALTSNEARHNGLIRELWSRLLGHPVDDASCDRGGEQRIAGGDRVHCGDQILRAHAFQQKARGPSSDAAEDVVLIFEVAMARRDVA